MISILPLRARKQHEKRQNFYDCIQPIFVPSRIFGLLKFNVHIDSSGRNPTTTVGKFDIFSVVGVIAINLVLSYLKTHSSRSVMRATSSSSTVVLLDRLVWTTFVFMSLSSIVLSMIHRNRFAKIVRDIIEIDKNVKFDC